VCGSRYTVGFDSPSGARVSAAFSLPSLPLWSSVLDECQRLQLATTPGELHGGLSGWLAGGGDNPAGWLQEVLLVDTGMPIPQREDPLGQLFEATLQQLNAPDFTFALLLPEADAPLLERSQELFAWCRGFVGGFGLAFGDRQELSEHGEDALADLARLASAHGQAEGDEDDEVALAEIEEFVRVAALLLHGEHVSAPVRRSLH